MSESEKIIEQISAEIEKCKGSKFVKVPFWGIFANHLAYQNRFGNSQIKNDVCNFLDYILKDKKLIYSVSKGTTVYRARKIKRTEIKKNESGIYLGFNEKDSGIPPHRATGNGRVNVSGIPILYTATEIATSCAELRPMKNDFISVAEYVINEDITVADFTLEQISKYDGRIEGNLFLKEMFFSFSMPISNDLIDYLPSEFIAEYIKLNYRDLSGIRYSSLHNEGGYNIALFNDKKVNFIKSSVVECSKVTYEYEDVKSE